MSNSFGDTFLLLFSRSEESLLYLRDLRYRKNVYYAITIPGTAKIWVDLKKGEKSKVHSYVMVVVANNSYGTIFVLSRRRGRHGEMEGKIILGKGSRRGRTDEPGRFSGRYQRGTCSSFSRALNRLPLAEGKKVGDREKWTRRAEGLVRSAGAWAPDILRTARHSSSSFWKRSSRAEIQCNQTCENISRPRVSFIFYIKREATILTIFII